MSRKTRKLIWSAPLVAVLAVAGALAIFVATAPNQAAADHVSLPGAPTDLLVEPAEGNAGRTSLVLTWKAPTDGPVTGYRIDYSTDNVEYKELVPNSDSVATTYTHTGLDSGKTYIYRVFAINSAGTGPVSETYSNTTKGPAGTPDDVIGLTAARAATTPEKWSQIDLSWTEPYGGGSKITGYCIEYVDVDTTTSWPADGAGCRATPPLAEAALSSGTSAGIILTGNTKTEYSHEDLAAGTRRYYRVFAMTGADAAVAVSEMPSNEASAITAPREKPMPPGTVRAAKSEDGATVNLYWYWPASNGGMDVSNFRIEVTTDPNDWPEPSETASDNPFEGSEVTNVVGQTPAEHRNGVLALVTADTAQNETTTLQGSHPHAVAAAATNKRLYYRVFTETGATGGNNVLRSGPSNHASVVVNGGSNPAIPVFEATGAAAADGNDGRTEIDLTWGPNVTWDDPTDNPDAGATLTYNASGYRLDYALGTGATDSDDELKWKPLWGNTGFTATKFTHESLKPSTRVYYRVFAIGPAQTISTASDPQNATTKEAGALDKVRNVRAVADSPAQITVTWDAPMGTMASDIEQYNVQWKKLGTADPSLDPAVAATDDGGLTTTESGSVTTYVHKDLSESESWLYRVTAVADGRTTNPTAAEYTEWVLATTPEAGKPDMPIGLVAEDARDSNLTAPGARGVLLIWDMPKGPAGSVIETYKVERKVMGTDDDFKALATTDGKRTTYTDSKEPAEGEVRYYRVAAVSKTTLTGEWATVRFPIDTMVIPGAPTLTATKDAAMPTSQINLTWTAPDSAETTVTGYIIERRYTGDMMGDIPSDGYSGMDGANRSFAFSNAMEWWETLNCKGMLAAAGSDADPTDMSNADVMMYCGHFLNTAPSNVTDATTELSAEAKMAVQALFDRRFIIVTDGAATYYMDTGLMGNTAYSYRVRAAHGDDAGMWSNTAMATTDSGNADPMAVGSITVAPLRAGETSDAITLGDYFNDADDDTLTYTAAVMPADGSIATAMISVDDSDPNPSEHVHTLTITGVAAGTATVTVTASDGMGGTDATQEIAVTVTRGMLTAPSNVMASHSGLEATVTWDGGMNADTFYVAMLRRDAEGNWDIDNAVYDQDQDGSPFTVNMATRPAGTYLVFVTAGSTDDGWTNWIAGSLDYAP